MDGRLNLGAVAPPRQATIAQQEPGGEAVRVEANGLARLGVGRGDLPRRQKGAGRQVVVPTRRQVYVRSPDGSPVRDMPAVEIGFADVTCS